MKKKFSIAYCERDGVHAVSSSFAYIYSAGYTGVSLAPAAGDISPALLSWVKDAGLCVESLYLPVDCINLLWHDSPALPLPADALPTDDVAKDESTWEALFALYSSFFAFAHSIRVEHAVLLPSVGEQLPPVSQKGIDRFRALADEAQRQGVRLLFENDRSAPHFEAVVRACCRGYHGVCFFPAKAWRYFGSSALPRYAAQSLLRVRLDDGSGDSFGCLPLDGDADLSPFVKSIAPLNFDGFWALSPDPSQSLYTGEDAAELAARGYDRLCDVLRLVQREAGAY